MTLETLFKNVPKIEASVTKEVLNQKVKALLSSSLFEVLSWFYFVLSETNHN